MISRHKSHLLFAQAFMRMFACLPTNLVELFSTLFPVRFPIRRVAFRIASSAIVEVVLIAPYAGNRAFGFMLAASCCLQSSVLASRPNRPLLWMYTSIEPIVLKASIKAICRNSEIAHCNARNLNRDLPHGVPNYGLPAEFTLLIIYCTRTDTDNLYV